mgnify:CR=1 FL=1
MNRFIRSATRSINTSLPIEISDFQFEDLLKNGYVDAKWEPHIKIFLQEAPIELLHNLVISGATTFPTLNSLYQQYAKFSDTREWVHAMSK